jgi:hypothetical protein
MLFKALPLVEGLLELFDAARRPVVFILDRKIALPFFISCINIIITLFDAFNLADVNFPHPLYMVETSFLIGIAIDVARDALFMQASSLHPFVVSEVDLDYASSRVESAHDCGIGHSRLQYAPFFV